MRNVGGVMAQRKLTRAIIAALKLAGIPCQWLGEKPNYWTIVSDDETNVELSPRGLSWAGPRGARTLLYNLKVPFLGNNVDLCLLDGVQVGAKSESIQKPSAYVAMGELKGGIDPAGADEHWKTAQSALVRIGTAFSNHRLKPHTFYIGAAIEKKMAVEIWQMLQRDILTNAGNLTDDNHVAAIANWLCGL
jgi:hypothetical protein